MSAFRAAQVILFTDDLPRAAAFYLRLGFTETFRVPADGEPVHVDFVLNGYKLGIATAAAAAEDHGLAPIAEGQRVAVILWTDDTASAYAELVASGTPALSAPHMFLGRVIAWTADPDGNPIQIVEAP